MVTKNFFPSVFILLIGIVFTTPLKAQIDSTNYFASEDYFDLMFKYTRTLQYDSAIWAGEESLNGFREFEDWPTVVQVNITIANSYQLLQDFEAYHQKVDYALSLANEKLPSNHIVMALVLNAKANAIAQKGDYDLASKSYLQAIAIDSLPQSLLGIFYSSTGLNYRKKGDYGESLRYFDYGRQLLRQSLDEESSAYHWQNFARSNNSYARVLRLQKDWTAALEIYQLVDSIYQTLELDRVYRKRIDCAHSMAFCYLGLGDYDAASEQLERSLSLEAGRKAYQEEVRAEIRAELAFSEGDKTKALQELKTALQISQQKSKPQETIQRLARRIAEIQTELGDYQAAQQQLAEAMSNITSKSNPAPSDYIYPDQGIPLLAQMAELQVSIAQSQQKTPPLDSALNLYKALSTLVRYNRNSFQADNSRLFLATQTLPIYEKAISLCYQLYEQTQDSKYLEEAFAFSELGKATLLRESLQSDVASKHQSLPDSLRLKERQLQQDIAFFKEKLFLNPVSPEEADSDSSLQAGWQAVLFDRENEYRRLSERLEQEYPSYYQAKYNVQNFKLSDIQAYLNSKQLLIEYFWGDKQLFVFKISVNAVHLERVEIDETLPQALTRVQAFLSKPSATDQAYLQYQRDSYSLYKSLLGNSGDLYEELIIIPDGPLGYLAFDALLTEAVNNADKLRYHELPYLLKKHRLYYQYSTALLLQTEERGRDASLAYGGFAPSYPALPNAKRATQLVLNQPLSQLAFTEEEVRNTQAIWGGKQFIGADATKEVFMKEAANYKLLHLAMHGLLSGENTEFAALAFHPESDSAGQFLLSMEEIAAMELAADLVVLSACETGAGRLRRGEGVISMARAFREAGCPNILMSLWTADDKSSTLIMQDFFGRLKAGGNIAESIRAAKLNLMSTQFLQSHPYYWAGFVPLGNPNDQKENSHLLLIMLMLLVGVGIGFVAYRTAEAYKFRRLSIAL